MYTERKSGTAEMKFIQRAEKLFFCEIMSENKFYFFGFVWKKILLWIHSDTYFFGREKSFFLCSMCFHNIFSFIGFVQKHHGTVNMRESHQIELGLTVLEKNHCISILFIFKFLLDFFIFHFHLNFQ